MSQVNQPTSDYASEILAGTYDFIDFGCKQGGSFGYCERVLGGKNGLGIDNNRKHVAAFIESGGNAVYGDITALDLPESCVRFVCISHVLEHLPSLDHVRMALLSAMRVARDFVYIVGPYFDRDEYLKSLGLKFYWSDWKWHPTHIETNKLAEILGSYGITDFTSWGRRPIKDSMHPAIHPLESPPNQHDYDESVHPKKTLVEFEQDMFKEMVLVIPVRPIDYLHDVLASLKLAKVLGPYTQLDHVLSQSKPLKSRPSLANNVDG